MALDKRWNGSTSSAYTTVANWDFISLRTGSYSWTLSGSGTNEYYLRTSGGADPGLSQPGAIYINSDSAATEGTVGSLTAGQWDYGDNDTLGYSTVYVRLSDGTDPDSKALDYVRMKQIPVAGDHVRIPAGSGNISSGLNQSAVAIGDFVVEDGYTGTIGSSSEYLRVDPDRFEFAGGGTSYIDIGSANIAVRVSKTAAAAEGEFGLYLLGSNITTLAVDAGDVGVAVRHGETATVATARLAADRGRLTLGEGVSLTTAYLLKGAMTLRCAATTFSVEGGVGQSTEAGAITTWNANGGRSVPSSTGTITTLNVNDRDAAVDFMQSSAARTVTTLNHNQGEVLIDRNVVTVTTYTAPTSSQGPLRILARSA